MNIKQILIEMKEQQRIVDSFFYSSQYGNQVQASHQIATNQAKDRLEVLNKWYENHLSNLVYPLFVLKEKNKNEQSLEGIKKQYNPHIIFSIMAPYKELADSLWSSVSAYGGQFGINQHVALLSSLSELCAKIGISEMSTPVFGGGFFVKTVEDLSLYIKEMLHGVVGDDLALLYFRSSYPKLFLSLLLDKFDVDSFPETDGKFFVVFTDISSQKEIDTLRKIFTNEPLVIGVTEEKNQTNKLELVEKNDKNEKKKKY
jgi:hypothetical protein